MGARSVLKRVKHLRFLMTIDSRLITQDEKTTAVFALQTARKQLSELNVIAALRETSHKDKAVNALQKARARLKKRAFEKAYVARLNKRAMPLPTPGMVPVFEKTRTETAYIARLKRRCERNRNQLQ